MRILVIEDDEVIAERIKANLMKAGFDVTVSLDGEEGLQNARFASYALVILDLMLPKRDGMSVCRALRVDRNPVPILMLTARNELDDRVQGLECGADDYLSKPFDFRELLARVRGLLRRDKLHKARVIYIADMEIDTTAGSVVRGGVRVALTRREYTLLEALARNEGRTLTRDYILEQVWCDDESSSNTVAFFVAQLRKKIDAGRSIRLIHTVHGVGYVLHAPGEELEEGAHGARSSTAR